MIWRPSFGRSPIPRSLPRTDTGSTFNRRTSGFPQVILDDSSSNFFSYSPTIFCRYSLNFFTYQGESVARSRRIARLTPGLIDSQLVSVLSSLPLPMPSLRPSSASRGSVAWRLNIFARFVGRQVEFYVPL
ncbi:hypothetical protein PILCRDRAFT_812930 [Piloderma croceum F 1598]|uniref:Uncharacterized protein n=1 Tax=Piloderma croceum (strain F 1598) TaxID=765440 RepID=A0A0C3CH08_PILCF|nr:hypothetical protein PILCRDRAFT_812930 [Piloderma croceum F 1598]